MAHFKGSEWSKAHDAILRKQWAEGKSGKLIGEAVGRSRAATLARANRLGLQPRVAEKADAVTPPRAERKHPLKPGLQVMRYGVLVTLKRPSPVPSRVEPRQCEPVTLLDRRNDQCGWPVNDGGPFLYCGAPKADRRYCAHHVRRARGRGVAI